LKVEMKKRSMQCRERNIWKMRNGGYETEKVRKTQGLCRRVQNA
jgi:hypothetical protein